MRAGAGRLDEKQLEYGKSGPIDEVPCQVLIVDDDSACLEECRELIEALGYACHVASDASMALRAVARNPRIGVVITDLKMPGIDGLTLLDELSQRFLPHRPLVTLVVTGQSSLDNAVNAMRSNAVDFLAKPIELGSLSISLRRATARWFRMAAHFRNLALSRTGSDPVASQTETTQNTPRNRPSVEELQRFATQMMKNRQSRSKFFDAQNFSGPAWDILLDLAAAGLKGESVATSSACASTQVPLSTALRHVNHLVEAGIVIRRLDSSDRRRTLLELEPQALHLMTRYLASSLEALGGPPR